MNKPNVIYILADDMGYGDFGAFNAGLTKTPALDRLVAEGVTLTNCHAASPVCAPARASILTGRYPQRCGVVDTLESRGLDRLKINETTLANVFKDNGYTTALVGKWHLGAIDPEYHPCNRGFDYFCGFRGGWQYYYDYVIERDGERLKGDGTYITDLFSDEAIAFVRHNANRPFFLHLTYNTPHFPLEAPEEIVARYRATGAYTEAVCRVYAMLEVMDSGIDKLLKELRNLNIDSNTLVIFSSDNGPDFSGEGENSLVRFNCDLRGAKMQVYEGGIRIPAVIRWTEKLPAGLQCDEFVHGTDWMPTLISLCDLSLSQEIRFDGIDVSDAFNGGRLPARNLFWQWNRYRPNLLGNAAATDTRYKLVHPPVFSYLDLPAWEVELDVDMKQHPENHTTLTDIPIPDLPPLDPPVVQLFDLSIDRSEEYDLAATEIQMVANLGSALKTWFAEVEQERLS